MPLPLRQDENIYIDHKIKDGTYSMPAMQAAMDHYTMGYVVSGDRRWISTDAVRTTHSGDVGISKPHVFHRNCSMSTVPYDRYVLKVRIETFEPLIQYIGQNEFDVLCSNYMHFTKEAQQVIHNMYDEILAEYEKNAPYSQFVLEGMVHKLFFYLYENHIPNESDQHTLHLTEFDERIHDALFYVENNLEQPLSITDTARYVSLSPSHFSRLFKKVTGTSYSDYLSEIRMQHAQILLLTSNLSIADIAAKIGLSNGNYLCTLFTQKYRCSPSQFRKKNK